MIQNITPSVSIVIPAYNAEKYIKTCVESILTQTYSNFEVIIVDDGSNDGTSLLIDDIVMRNSCIRACHKENGGATSARRRGVEEAKGEWILFMDADDTMPSDALQDLVSHSGSKFDIVAGTIMYNSKNHLIKTNSISKSIRKEEYIHLLLNRETYYGPCAKLIRRSLFDEFVWNDDPRLFQNEDLLMLVQLAAKSTLSVSICNEHVHYICEEKEGSMSTKHMSYEGWKILFIDLKSVIMTMSNSCSGLFSDYVNYSLWSIYDCLLSQAINVPQDAYIHSLIEDSKTADISDKNKNVLIYLENPIRRYLYCCYRKVRMGLKGLLNLK